MADAVHLVGSWSLRFVCFQLSKCVTSESSRLWLRSAERVAGKASRLSVEFDQRAR